MNKLLIAAAATILLGASTLSSPVYAADDAKMFHGSDCKVFGATAWTDLNFTGYGVRNVASAARNIICPMFKDQEGAIDNSQNFGKVHMHADSPGGPSTLNCTVYETTLESLTNTSISTGAQAVGPTNTSYSMTLPNPPAGLGNGFDHDKLYMLCTLGAGARLTGYNLYEYGAAPTNAP